MKFFKYLIFILLSFFSINVFAVFYEYRGLNSVTTGDWMSTPELACKNFIAKWAPSAPYVRSSETECVYRTTDGDRGAQLEKRESTTCPSTVTSMPISVPGWTNWNIDQIDAYSSKIQGKTACYKGCKYKNPTMTGSEGSDSMSLLYGDPVKDASCPNTETRPDTPYPDNVTPPQDGCKNGEAYCDKPTTGCPSGYTSGSFNGKQICVKNSTDPTKPNPNDPNNGGGKGEGSCNGTNNCNTTNFDDSKIINAINNAVSSITNSLNTINESITTVANAVNATTNAVNNNTSAVNAVKSSVDALHNTINAVTTAVNNNTSAVTSAVHSNTTATNAVKASVDALNSTVSAVTTAVENLNSAVNAVSDAVNANGKNTVDSINANGKNTVDAINTNGKNTVDSVNKGTEATKENGKKLDGINDSVKEGNGFLKDIKDWLTQTPPNGEDAQIPKKELEKKSFNENLLSISAPNCPPDWRFNWVTPFGTIDKTVSYQDLCDSSGWLGYLFLAISYVIGARIVMGDS